MDDQNAPATKADIAFLRTDLDILRTVLDIKLNQFGAATKADIGILRTELDILRTDLDTKLNQFSAEANHRYDDIVERIADSQTELLKAFYGYAQGNNKRVAELEGNEERSAAVSQPSKTVFSKSNGGLTCRPPPGQYSGAARRPPGPFESARRIKVVRFTNVQMLWCEVNVTARMGGQPVLHL